MFTGIVTDIGTLITVERPGDMRARIGTAYAAEGIDIGASIACDGVCLTVVAKGRAEAGADEPDNRPGNWFDVDISAETLSASNLGGWQPGHRVNLERALKVGDELGGHIVSGHVDGTARLLDLRPEGDSTRLTFEAPEHLARFIAPKGSVALNGTSLTVNEVEGRQFGVNLIPHTMEATNWGAARAGDAINLEIDTLARYVARLHQAG